MKVILFIILIIPLSLYCQKKDKKKSRKKTNTSEELIVNIPDSTKSSLSAKDTLYLDTISIVDVAIENIADTIAAIDSIKLKDTISIIGVGDMMLGTAYPERWYLPANEDCLPLMADVKDILINADITFANLEGAMTNSHEQAKYCSNPKACYAFAMPEKFIGCFAEVGIDVVSIANNHSGDFNYQGRKRTGQLLDSVQIEYAGTTKKPYVIFKKDSITYGMAAFAPNWETPQITNLTLAKETVKHLDSLCDIVIVSFHGGAEGSKYERVPKTTETFYGENRGNVHQFAHTVIDAGADIVFGHGPHVTRALELYKDRLICYSLGNFCTYGRFNLDGPNGMAPIIKVFTDRKGAFYEGKIYPIVQYDGVGTRRDPMNRVIKRLQELTTTDFPATPLLISGDGKITKKVITQE